MEGQNIDPTKARMQKKYQVDTFQPANYVILEAHVQTIMIGYVRER
jgi:hypothetical protein